MKRLSSLLAVIALLVGVLLLAGSPPAAAQEGGEPTPAVEEPVHGETTSITEGETASNAEQEDIQPIQFALRLTSMGMGVVFTALLILSGLLRIAQRASRTEAPVATAPAAAPAMPAPEARDGISPEVMAAISAAVTIATQKRFRIKRIRYHEAPPLDAWSRQGRITIMTSRRGRQQGR